MTAKLILKVGNTFLSPAPLGQLTVTTEAELKQFGSIEITVPENVVKDWIGELLLDRPELCGTYTRVQRGADYDIIFTPQDLQMCN